MNYLGLVTSCYGCKTVTLGMHFTIQMHIYLILVSFQYNNRQRSRKILMGFDPCIFGFRSGQINHWAEGNQSIILQILFQSALNLASSTRPATVTTSRSSSRDIPKTCGSTSSPITTRPAKDSRFLFSQLKVGGTTRKHSEGFAEN